MKPKRIRNTFDQLFVKLYTIPNPFRGTHCTYVQKENFIANRLYIWCRYLLMRLIWELYVSRESSEASKVSIPKKLFGHNRLSIFDIAVDILCNFYCSITNYL